MLTTLNKIEAIPPIPPGANALGTIKEYVANALTMLMTANNRYNKAVFTVFFVDNFIFAHPLTHYSLKLDYINIAINKQENTELFQTYVTYAKSL
jgi:hypothetical protein